LAQLEANRLCLFKGGKAGSAAAGEKAIATLLLDGLIIDESDKKEHAVFIGTVSAFCWYLERLLLIPPEAATNVLRGRDRKKPVLHLQRGHTAGVSRRKDGKSLEGAPTGTHFTCFTRANVQMSRLRPSLTISLKKLVVIAQEAGGNSLFDSAAGGVLVAQPVATNTLIRCY
jgi:hypothetical protein